jgi:hypothetical protein
MSACLLDGPRPLAEPDACRRVGADIGRVARAGRQRLPALSVGVLRCFCGGLTHPIDTEASRVAYDSRRAGF